MKDFLGQELVVGAKVILVEKGRISFVTGNVYGIAETKVRVRYTSTLTGNVEIISRRPNQVIVVDRTQDSIRKS